MKDGLAILWLFMIIYNYLWNRDNCWVFFLDEYSRIENGSITGNISLNRRWSCHRFGLIRHHLSCGGSGVCRPLCSISTIMIPICGFPGMCFYALNTNICIRANRASIHTQYMFGMYSESFEFALDLYSLLGWYFWICMYCMYLQVCLVAFSHAQRNVTWESRKRDEASTAGAQHSNEVASHWRFYR